MKARYIETLTAGWVMGQNARPQLSARVVMKDLTQTVLNFGPRTSVWRCPSHRGRFAALC